VHMTSVIPLHNDMYRQLRVVVLNIYDREKVSFHLFTLALCECEHMLVRTNACDHVQDGISDYKRTI